MNRLKKISYELFLLTLGRSIYAICLWLSIIVMARSYGSLALGQFTYAMAVIAPIIIFFQFNTRTFLLTETKDSYGLLNHIAFRFIGIILSYFTLFIISKLNAASGLSQLLTLVLFFKSVESLSDIIGGYLHRERKFKSIFLANSIRGVSFLLASYICAFKNLPLTTLCWLIAISWVAILFLIESQSLLKILHDINPTKKFAVLSLLNRCWLFGPVMALSALIYNVPIYYVENILGSSHVGYYTSIMYFYLSGRLLIDSSSQILAPRMARIHSTQDIKIVESRIILIITAFMATTIAIAICGFKWGDIFVKAIYGEEFSDFGYYLGYAILALIISLTNQIFNIFYTVKRDIKNQLSAHLIALLTAITISPVLINQIGLDGAFISLMISMLTISLYYLASAKNKLLEI